VGPRLASAVFNASLTGLADAATMTYLTSRARSREYSCSVIEPPDLSLSSFTISSVTL
jgi:hypothetical protein